MNITCVNDKNEIIGSGSKWDAYSNNIAVRIVRVLLVREDGALLIQKRSPTVQLPNKWDQTAAGHVDEGESYIQAANRELEEEMGISDVQLKEISTYYTEDHDDVAFVMKRFNTLYVGKYAGNISNNEEVGAYRWITPGDLRKELSETPGNFTEGCREAFRIYLADNINF